MDSGKLNALPPSLQTMESFNAFNNNIRFIFPELGAPELNGLDSYGATSSFSLATDPLNGFNSTLSAATLPVTTTASATTVNSALSNAEIQSAIQNIISGTGAPPVQDNKAGLYPSMDSPVIPLKNDVPSSRAPSVVGSTTSSSVYGDLLSTTSLGGAAAAASGGLYPTLGNLASPVSSTAAPSPFKCYMKVDPASVDLSQTKFIGYNGNQMVLEVDPSKATTARPIAFPVSMSLRVPMNQSMPQVAGGSAPLYVRTMANQQSASTKDDSAADQDFNVEDYLIDDIIEDGSTSTSAVDAADGDSKTIPSYMPTPPTDNTDADSGPAIDETPAPVAAKLRHDINSRHGTTKVVPTADELAESLSSMSLSSSSSSTPVASSSAGGTRPKKSYVRAAVERLSQRPASSPLAKQVPQESASQTEDAQPSSSATVVSAEKRALHVQTVVRLLARLQELSAQQFSLQQQQQQQQRPAAVAESATIDISAPVVEV
ncbi:hypothetical protein GQ42DRAFT_163248 [Ramicandelaber brevisporus]|nr:hypothetical protein GQ42DRAFT_163248 [Ramicandelaber brevisporus]